MSKTEVSQQEGLQKKKVFFRVKLGEKFTEYKAVYGRVELWGKTVGTRDNIKDIVRRIIRAPNGIPDSVTNAAIGLSNYIASMASINSSSRVVWGGVELVYGPGCRLKLGVGLYYVTDYDTGKGSMWRGEVEAVYMGNDGYIGNAIHKVVRPIVFKEIDVVWLYCGLLRVARHAINASFCSEP